MKSFTIENFKIVVTKGGEAYNDLRLKYQSLADSASNEFNKQYNIRFENIDDIHKKCPELAQKYLISTVDTAINDIIKAGINDISDEMFITKYVSHYISWDDDFAEIDDQYLKIILEADAYNEYKNSRSNSGGNVIGGGFGIEGAATGVAIATAANLAIGAVGGMLNAASNGLNSQREKKLKQDLFNDPNTKLHLVKSIYSLVFKVHLAVSDVIQEHNKDTMYENVSELNQSKANAIFENIKKGRIPKKNMKSSLIDALKLDPYLNDLYEFWFNEFGNSNNELLVMANYFGLRKINYIKNTTSIIQQESNKVENFTDSSTNKKLEKEFNKKGELIEATRWFDGKMYSSPEEAIKMRVIYIKTFLESGKRTNEGKINELSKIYGTDEQQPIGITKAILVFFAAISLIAMFVSSPWWLWFIIFSVTSLLVVQQDESIKKKKLKEWLEKNK